MTLAPDTFARLGPLSTPASDVARRLAEMDAVRRLFSGDHTLWRDDPTEIADRLGWVPVVSELRNDLTAIQRRCDALLSGVDHVLVMGMGGSSLFPEVLAQTFESARGRPSLHVLDTTDPDAIATIAATCPPDRTLHLAASKSGSTIETRSHLEWAWDRSGDASRFAVITDPGSELGDLARDRGFGEVFENRADIGGRYAALSLFGLVPALLAGLDGGALLDGGMDALTACGPEADPGMNPALALAAVLAAGVGGGRDKATFVLDAEVATLGLWLEQLIAESLGKEGTGVVPIVGEPLGEPSAYGDDRLFLVDPTSGDQVGRLAEAGHPVVALPSARGPRALGHLVVVAELATALAGAALHVQPFDQPDVAAAKAATNEVLEAGGATITEVPLADLVGTLRPGDHLAIQAFVNPFGPLAAPLAAARVALRDEHRVATSLGFGPRFLHSTGQLHKGGPPGIVCVQVLVDAAAEIAIPGRDFGFGHLKSAQAAGDLRALQAREIRAGRVRIGELVSA